MKYACIARHRGEFEVRLMCRVLAVSRSGFYTAQRRAPSAHAQTDQQLRLVIRTAHAESAQRYGAPKIHAALRDQDIRCGRKRVARLMKDDGLRGTCPRAFRVTTTQSQHAEPIAPNLLARRFTPAAYVERDRVWVADITYLRTQEGVLYLAVVLDLASRRVVGWATDPSLAEALTLRALGVALTLRQPAPGIIHHSDRGSHGGFNRSSQHLMSEVDDVKDRQAQIESFDTKQIALTWSAACIGQGGAAALLGGDCAWPDE